jgi:hypothetical protein
MSGKFPIFTTGSNCYIKINGTTIAYATGLEVSVDVPHNAYYTLGRYEPENIQPASYSVKGSFSVLKYIEGQRYRLGHQVPDGVKETGSSIGAMSATGGNLDENPGKLLSDEKVQFSLMPKYLNQSVFFDIEVYQKLGYKETTGRNLTWEEGLSRGIIPGNPALKGITHPAAEATSGVLRIRQCRITSMKQTLTKKEISIQHYTFEATYLDDDTFVALASTN